MFAEVEVIFDLLYMIFIITRIFSKTVRCAQTKSKKQGADSITVGYISARLILFLRDKGPKNPETSCLTIVE